MIRLLGLILSILLFFSCGGGKRQGDGALKDSEQAKAMFQGVWIEDETDSPFMRVVGDTIYYSDPQNIPVFFRIYADTLFIHGKELKAYRIDQQKEYSFWIHTMDDNVVKLHKSETLNDTLSFRNVESILTNIEKVQKDSVVIHQGTRYRAYVYINPSKMRVIRSAYTDGGLSIDNVYYDNVMHICVYEGRNCLYKSDITKQAFAEVIPEDFLNQAILSDMNFIKVDSKGFHYQATVCIPETYVCNIVNLVVGFDWKLSITAT